MPDKPDETGGNMPIDDRSEDDRPKGPMSPSDDGPTVPEESEETKPSTSDEGEAWRINEDPEDRADGDETQGRPGRQEGEAWTINENTRDDAE